MIKHFRKTYIINNEHGVTYTAILNSELELLERSNEVPHECEFPECPGNKTRRKLELYEDFRKLCEDIMTYRDTDPKAKIPEWLMVDLCYLRKLLNNAEALEGK